MCNRRKRSALSHSPNSTRRDVTTRGGTDRSLPTSSHWSSSETDRHARSMADPQPTLLPERIARDISSRPTVRGKFLWAGDQKLLIHGVTYGTFAANSAGEQYPERKQVERDFHRMERHSINAIRTYTVPPSWLLDLAARHCIRVMVGVPWEQHVAFLDDSSLTRSIDARVRGDVERCAGHPSVLAYAVGNEIPTSIVRWHGRARVESFIDRLGATVKDVDAAALV